MKDQKIIQFEGDSTDVFPSRGDQPPFFRIPALAMSSKGTLLAFCERRNHRGGDHAANDILLRRSRDNGLTWGPIRTVAADGGNSLNNPTVVVLLDTGRILIVYQRYPEGYHVSPNPDKNLGGVEPGYEGERICRTFLRSSDDDGLSWSPPREITRQVKRSEHVRATLSGPGIGIQLRGGRRKGRIVIPFYEGPEPYKVYPVFSDDGGDTWSHGEPAANGCEGGGNENQMVELNEGAIMVNSRRSGPGAPCRKKALSHDGGETWSPLADEPELPEPACQGSILRYSYPKGTRPGILVFSGPSSPKERKFGLVRLSFDEGGSWPVARSLGDEQEFFCYSCLAPLADGRIGCLYEHTPSKEQPITISMARFSLNQA